MRWEEYKSNVAVECKKCGWKGRSKQAELDPIFEEEADLDCPKCGENIAIVVVALYDRDLEKMAAEGNAWAKKVLDEKKKS